jgi:hypothetical protein
MGISRDASSAGFTGAIYPSSSTRRYAHEVANLKLQAMGISIDRYGFYVRTNRICAGHCPDCGASIDGIGMSAYRQGYR